MRWNWQKPDWPRFTWDKNRLAKEEGQFLRKTGIFAGAVKHLGTGDLQQLTAEAMSTEALTTSAIEGEILDRASVQSSIRKQLGLAVDHRRIGRAEQGIAEMTVDVYRRFEEPLSHETLFAWNKMLLRGRDDIADVGRYRAGSEPMQVVSGSVSSRKVHFEAPPSSAMPKEMTRFLYWFNQTSPDSKEPLPSLTRAGIAHLYFVTIHPFEDGNGRIARAIAEKALAQGLGQPTLIALAATILAKRKAYYDALEAANKSNEVTAWLCWFAESALQGQQATIALVEFVIEKTRMLDRLRGQINDRQQKALLRMLREGPQGFKGGLSAENYQRITASSPATTTRDLVDLVAKGALVRVGDRRYARYHLLIRAENSATPPASP
jgi:Fic family protein